MALSDLLNDTSNLPSPSGGEAEAIRGKVKQRADYESQYGPIGDPLANQPKSQSAMRPAPIANEGAGMRVNRGAQARYGRPGTREQRIDVTDMVKKLPTQKVQGSFKKGGKVKKTGVYKLHKKEVVLPAKHAAKLGRIASALTKINKQEAEEGNE